MEDVRLRVIDCLVVSLKEEETVERRGSAMEISFGVFARANIIWGALQGGGWGSLAEQ